MRDASAFEGVVLLGLARRSRQDPYRLSLFAQHLEADEQPRALLAIHGGTLVVTDRRLLELRAHLEVHGAWNVKEFQGYEVRRQIPRASVQEVVHEVSTSPERHAVEDALRVVLRDRSEEIVVSRGPAPTLTDEDVTAFRAAVFNHAK